MDSAVEKLAKYIELESERGYDNKAVFGGLNQILEPWAEEAGVNGLPDELIEAVSSRLRDYDRMSPDSRKAALDGLWRRIKRQYPELVSEASQNDRAIENQREQASSATDGGSPGSEPSLPSGTTGSKSTAQLQVEQAPGTPVVEVSPEKASSPDIKSEPDEDDVSDEPPAALDAPLTTIPGIGPKSAKTLAKLDLYTLGDLLWHFPRRYDDYSQLKTINRIWYGEDLTLIGTVEEIKVRPVRSGKMKLVEAVISDGTGSIRVTWFNQAWIATKLTPGKAVVLSGKVDQYLGKLTLNSP